MSMGYEIVFFTLFTSLDTAIVDKGVIDIFNGAVKALRAIIIDPELAFTATLAQRIVSLFADLSS